MFFPDSEISRVNGLLPRTFGAEAAMASSPSAAEREREREREREIEKQADEGGIYLPNSSLSLSLSLSGQLFFACAAADIWKLGGAVLAVKCMHGREGTKLYYTKGTF
jgi:hypothetical protein